jgi:hypothetical protein
MISKKLIITEEERKEIKTLYGLIREQEASQKNPELTLDLSGTFGSGKYKLPEKADRVDDLINQIREFKKQNAGSVIEISVNSGESQVPNYDREKFPSTGNAKVDFTDEKKLPVGAIAKYRAAALKSYIEKVAPDLLKDSKLVISEPIIGGTKWNPQGGDTAKDEKFTKEQFANFKIKVIGKKSDMGELPSSGTTGCATGLRIKIWVPQHQCNNAEFFIMLNNTVLYNVDGGYTANLNNANTTKEISGTELVPQLLNPAYGYISTKYGKQKKGDLGGARLDEFVVTPEQSKTIVQSGKGYIYVWMIGTTKEIHKDIPRVSINKNDEVVYQGAPKVASGLLLVLDACGNKVAQIPEGSNTKQPDVSSWLSKLIADRSKINVKDKLPKKIDSKELLLKNSGKLVDSINNLETYLKTNIFKGQNKKSESQEYYTFRKNKANLINQTYFDIYQILQSNNWIRKNPFENSYSNKFVESDMGGDIKLDLDKFYDTFNKIYYDDTDSKYIPNGTPSASSIAKKLGIKYS